MEEIGNILKFDVNENRPIFDNHKVSSNEVLNRSPENKLSAVESAAFFQNSTVTERQVLTSVNNNCENEKPNSSFTIEDNSTCVSNNSAENITSVSSEAGTTKTENINSISQVYETASNIDSSNIISANLSLDGTPVGNVNFLPEVLSEEICSDNRKNLSNIAVRCDERPISKVEIVDSISNNAEELEGEKNNSFMVFQDLVDFSFKEQGNVSNLIGNCAAVDSVSKHPETFPINTLEKICLINATANKLVSETGSISGELIETDGVKVPNEPSNNSTDFGIKEATEICAVVSGDSTNNDSLLGVSETPEKKADSNVIVDKNDCEFDPFDISAGKKYGVVSSEGAAFQLCENPSSNELHEFSLLKVEKTSFDMTDKPFEQVSDSLFAIKLPENPSKPLDEISPLKVENVSVNVSDKHLEQFSGSDIAFKVHDNLSSMELDKISPLKVENVSFGMSDKSPEQFSDPRSAFKVHENTSSNEQDEISPLKVENVSFGMSDKPLEQFFDPDSAFKVPENPISHELNEVSPLKCENISFNLSDKPLEQFSDPDIAFKVSENPSCNEDEVPPVKVEKVSFDMSDKHPEQFSDPDFTFKVPEIPSNNLLGQLRNPECAFKKPEKPLTNEDDEQFVDAAQFFKDPNSFQFLENIRTSTLQPGPAAPRSSLYVNFDPLHSKFQTNVPRLDNCELISAAVQEQRISDENYPEVVNKHLVDVASRESTGNILISFDSPKSSASSESKMPVEVQSPPKMFTEEELQKKLKNCYLETQEVYLKKQREMEMEISKREELLKAQQMVISEFCGISFNFSEDVKSYQAKVISLEEENEKLKDDLKTSAEDLQSVETTFADFHKRYEQCKGMLKTYKDNEEHLKQTILDLQEKAKEQEQMYNMLQKRTEEMLEKANDEVDIAKRSGEAQVTVLKAQLKKAEMKISSLESDNKQIKMENSQLGGICDDLMAKVSKS